jgi:tRNA(fMet)-specific endonuclease VapC
MTCQYLLDTNIISDLVRHPQGLVFQRIATVGEDSICTSIIVVCELRFGAVKSGSPRLVQQLERILEVLPILFLSRLWISTMRQFVPNWSRQEPRSARMTY